MKPTKSNDFKHGLVFNKRSLMSVFFLRDKVLGVPSVFRLTLRGYCHWLEFVCTFVSTRTLYLHFEVGKGVNHMTLLSASTSTTVSHSTDCNCQLTGHAHITLGVLSVHVWKSSHTNFWKIHWDCNLFFRYPPVSIQWQYQRNWVICCLKIIGFGCFTYVVNGIALCQMLEVLSISFVIPLKCEFSHWMARWSIKF